MGHNIQLRFHRFECSASLAGGIRSNMTGLVLLAALATQAQELKTATTHPIQFPFDAIAHAAKRIPGMTACAITFGWIPAKGTAACLFIRRLVARLWMVERSCDPAFRGAKSSRFELKV